MAGQTVLLLRLFRILRMQTLTCKHQTVAVHLQEPERQRGRARKADTVYNEAVLERGRGRPRQLRYCVAQLWAVCASVRGLCVCLGKYYCNE